VRTEVKKVYVKVAKPAVPDALLALVAAKLAAKHNITIEKNATAPTPVVAAAAQPRVAEPYAVPIFSIRPEVVATVNRTAWTSNATMA
jgi:hypothetical protein